MTVGQDANYDHVNLTRDKLISDIWLYIEYTAGLEFDIRPDTRYEKMVECPDHPQQEQEKCSEQFYIIENKH